MTDRTFDMVVVGAGIVGLATAREYQQRFPGKRVLLLEKEWEIASHQTGRNSGVIHSGVYYTPGSLKAKNCREGKELIEAFCDREGIEYDLCGKVIVAVSNEELPILENIYWRGQANGVTCEMISQERLAELEPHTAGIAAIHVPEAGIVDYTVVAKRLAERIREAGGEILTGARVYAISEENRAMIVESTAGTFRGSYLINCAGLYSDKVTGMTGQAPQVKIIPFRGEYFELRESARHLCRTLIYPVPDPAFPFLGVHFTSIIGGGVECGPNAVLALAREGYNKSDLDIAELAETLTYPGFIKLALKYWKTGLGEQWRSISKRAFVRALQRLVPEISEEDLEAVPAGIRAQAITPDGKMVDDFLFQDSGRVINVGNAPSPAATSSLRIGKTIIDRLEKQMDPAPTATV
ncbi:MAG: L-2-hydroxyglutarate oxidase [Balneolaceae bacterium]